jgi:PilZ domain
MHQFYAEGAMEHRWGARTALDLPVTLYAGLGAIARGRIANASLSGALVCTDVQLPLLARVRVEVDDDYTSCAPHLVEAYVVRRSAVGLGLEWTDFSPPAIAALLGRGARPQVAGQRGFLLGNHASGTAVGRRRFEQRP